MQKYRKKPVVIEAMQFLYTKETLQDLKSWMGPSMGRYDRKAGAKAELEIGTLEDGIHLTVKHIATEGDWIIKGVQDEFYACKESIFIQTYELVEE